MQYRIKVIKIQTLADAYLDLLAQIIKTHHKYPPGNESISYLGKRKIILKVKMVGDMLVSGRVPTKSSTHNNSFLICSQHIVSTTSNHCYKYNISQVPFSSESQSYLWFIFHAVNWKAMSSPSSTTVLNQRNLKGFHLGQFLACSTAIASGQSIHFSRLTDGRFRTDFWRLQSAPIISMVRWKIWDSSPLTLQVCPKKGIKLNLIVRMGLGPSNLLWGGVWILRAF